MITLRHLRYFVATAEMGSATRAAEVLNVSQPSVSAAVRDLEAELGQPLFERRQARGLGLTKFGSDKLSEARRVLDAADRFAAPTGPTQVSHLSLGYFKTIGPSWIPGVLAQIACELPGLDVNLHECDLEEMALGLEKARFELGLTYDVGLPNSIARKLLVEIEPHALLPPDHPLAAQRDVTLAELAEHPFVLVDLPLSREFLMAPFWQRNLSPPISLRTGSVEMVRGMVANGIGVSVLFTRPRHDLAEDGRRVVCRPIRDEMIRQRLVIAYPEGGPVTQAAHEALSCVVGHFARQATAN